MEMKEIIKKDTEYFKNMFEELDKEGRFSDRLPNSALKYDADTEMKDLLRYEKNIMKPNSLSFWR